MPFTVLFDNDGVLVDTEERYFEATREVLAARGVELTREYYIEHSLRRGQSTLELARRAGCGDAEMERLRAARNARYAELLAAAPCVIPGVPEALSRLRGRVRMGIVTSSLKPHFDVIHAASGLLGCFEFVLTREDYTRAKPHPDAYLAALERFRLRPEECVVVEDTGRGLAAARAAGLRCLVIPHGLTRGADFSGACKVLTGIRELPAEVAALFGLSP
jgi:HAD superfamily hydrolase (TIGR01509 family)